MTRQVAVHRLEGCRPEPLASYLKALGLLRLVGLQADPVATGHWIDDRFELRSTLDEPALLDFLESSYRPTPLVTPWNGGSGFYPKDKKGHAALALIEQTAADRFSAYRDTIASARRIASQGGSKEAMIERCRAELPDEAVEWLDAAVVLTGDDEVRFPLLLGGTGGNLGRLDLPVNFMERLADVLALGPRHTPESRRKSWLRAALYADTDPPRLSVAIGQFDPASASGANSSPLGMAESLVNPWDFVLLMEGALVFASAAARRLGASSGGTAAMPFTVGASRVGYGSSAAGENSKGEIWAPLWERPATFAEIGRLISEGRSTWNRHQARTGLDFARAAASLGVDRGINSFVRFGLVERHGQSLLAVPLGRVPVSIRPGIPLLRSLDGWLDRTRRSSDPPAAVVSMLRRCDAALYTLATRAGQPRPEDYQDVVTAVGALEGAIGRAGSFRDRANLRPVSGLSAQDWLGLLDDGTNELRLAAALASQTDTTGVGLRSLLTPVERDQSRWRFSEGAPPVPGLGHRSVVEVLAGALAARALEAHADEANVRDASEGDTSGGGGIDVRYRWDRRAPLESVGALLRGQIDERRLASLLRGMLALDWVSGTTPWRSARPAIEGAADIHFASPLFTLLAPLFHGRPLSTHVVDQDASERQRSDQRVRLRLQPTWPALLVAGRLDAVAADALRRLAMAGLSSPLRPRYVTPSGAEAHRLGSWVAAALLCPLFRVDAAALLRRVVPPHLDDPVEVIPATVPV